MPVTFDRPFEKDRAIKRIVLHLNDDVVGRKATKVSQAIPSDKYEAVDDSPQHGKDVNDLPCKCLEIRNKTEKSFAR